MRLPLSIYYGPRWWRLIARDCHRMVLTRTAWIPENKNTERRLYDLFSDLPEGTATIHMQVASGGMN